MNDPFLICSSYGNDSIATIQFLIECGATNVSILYNDTGWSADWWSHRVSRCEAWANCNGFKTFRTISVGMENLVKQRKGCPRQGLQFCTQQLKIVPTLEWLKINDPDYLFCCVIGKRREESKNRRNIPEFEQHSSEHDFRPVWHPLYLHTESDRNRLLIRAGFDVLPHRSKEYKLCINEKREGIAKADEKTILEIEQIEKKLGYTSKGKLRSIFRPYRYMGATGIREIVK